MNQVTLGITAQSFPRVLIDERVYDLDVGSGHPNGVTAIKGSFVQRLTVLRDLSSDRRNPGQFLSMKKFFLVRKDRKNRANTLSTLYSHLLKQTQIGKKERPITQKKGNYWGGRAW